MLPAVVTAGRGGTGSSTPIPGGLPGLRPYFLIPGSSTFHLPAARLRPHQGEQSL